VMLLSRLEGKVHILEDMELDKGNIDWVPDARILVDQSYLLPIKNRQSQTKMSGLLGRCRPTLPSLGPFSA
jgi:hypothetical protein